MHQTSKPKSNKPFLRWAGSKRKLLPKLAEYWDSGFEEYVEPFFGSGALYFHLGVTNAILGDTNPHLVRLYNTIQDHWDTVHARWVAIPIDKAVYYSIRERGFDIEDDIEFSANFLYLNRNCFNGLYRTNTSGQFNVPFSGSKTGAPIDRNILEAAAKQLEGAQIVNSDFEKLIKDVDPKGRFFYLDPPYAIRNRRMFRQYGPDTFGLEDLERLDDCLAYIDQHGGKFLLSYANEDDIASRYSNWKVATIDTVRNIAGFAKHRGTAKELLVSNF